MEAAFRRIKPSPPTTKKKNTANEKGGDGTDRDDNDAEAVVWEELNDEYVIQRIVWRCMKNVYKLSEERIRDKAERKQKARMERKRIRQRQRSVKILRVHDHRMKLWQESKRKLTKKGKKGERKRRNQHRPRNENYQPQKQQQEI